MMKPCLTIEKKKISNIQEHFPFVTKKYQWHITATEYEHHNYIRAEREFATYQFFALKNMIYILYYRAHLFL